MAFCEIAQQREFLTFVVKVNFAKYIINKKSNVSL